jgi:hypothetical protein
MHEVQTRFTKYASQDYRELPSLINCKKVVVFDFSQKCTDRQTVILGAF